MSKQPIINLPYSDINGFNVAWASNTTLTVTSGLCRDSTNVFDLKTTATKTIDAAVNGVNGLDTGSFAASKCYAIHVIGDSSGFNSTGVLLSLSDTAPTMPDGYDIFRRVGWAMSDGSTHFILIYQSGIGSVRSYTYDEPVSVLSGGSSATFAAVALTEKVPAVNNLQVFLAADFTPNAANDVAYLRSGGSSATNGITFKGSVAAKISSCVVPVVAKLVTAAPTIEYKVTASGALTALLVSFVDYI